MREFYKQSIFWFGLLDIAQKNSQLKYYITTQKELIYNLYPVVYLGVIQYSLYRGEDIEIIPTEEAVTYSQYILEKYEQIYKIRFRFAKNKPKKLNLKEPEVYELCEEIIINLLIPYINEYCFRTYDQWKNLVNPYIRESAINFEYDINHNADDGKIKTSILYPFIFTLCLITIQENHSLYQIIESCYKKNVLLKKFNSGRQWKEKELNYLDETFELIKNDEEWLIFLSNFSQTKWDKYDLKERFKALFQLTKLTTILMKEEISTVTMLDDGDELFDQIKNYLPLFIYKDKIIDKDNNLKSDYKNSNIKIISPFSNQNINLAILPAYIGSKGQRFIECDLDVLKTTTELIYNVLAKSRLILLIHEYLPSFIDSKININKKLYVDVLKIFKETKPGKFKNEIEVESLLEANFMISEDDINQILESEYTNFCEFHQKTCFYNMARLMSLLLGMENKTASIMKYDFYELFKNVFILIGPHPLDHTVQSKEMVDKLYNKFLEMLLDYEKNVKVCDRKNCDATAFLELPLKLLTWKKRQNN